MEMLSNDSQKRLDFSDLYADLLDICENASKEAALLLNAYYGKAQIKNSPSPSDDRGADVAKGDELLEKGRKENNYPGILKFICEKITGKFDPDTYFYTPPYNPSEAECLETVNRMLTTTISNNIRFGNKMGAEMFIQRALELIPKSSKYSKIRETLELLQEQVNTVMLDTPLDIHPSSGYYTDAYQKINEHLMPYIKDGGAISIAGDTAKLHYTLIMNS